ncbi:hypothetical protein SAMN05661091_4355 [Paenibacillus uliginis N3/975]|uniref:Uncharacterized protein n=1 Tax=Paenibacillus uliginis N3/975 TaxID=1313296 RepID=A0A1X7HN03_9BACL|nr:hypothetical protein [Paenibacillus uliginis]SMF88638.1 hypothetical protein SAMN05661091_4355 [Paenibacillus uliginis N3/975]
MSRAGKKLIAIVIWAGIGVLIGMQLGGMEGPMVQKGPMSGQVQQAQQGQGDLPALDHKAQDAASKASAGETAEQVDDRYAKEEQPKFEPTPRDILLPESSKPPADVLADKTAGLLQQLSNQSIRWVVSMFGSITD